MLIFLLFLVQPLFLAGILYSLWNYRKRLTYVRETYRMNFNRKAFELSDYFLKGILLAIGLSGLSIALGVPLTIEWYLLYQGISLLLLAIGGSRFIHPVFSFSLTSIVLFLMDQFGQSLPLSWLSQQVSTTNFLIDFKEADFASLSLNTLFFTALMVLFTGLLIKNKDFNKLYPILRASKRGKTIAKYQNKFLWLLPLAVMVPGNLIEPFAPWWPFLSIGGNKFAILILPVLIGLKFTVSTQLIEEAIENIKKDFQILGIVGILLFVGSYFYEQLAIISLVILLLGAFFIYYRHRQREKLWTFKYGPAEEGLRVIAVRPGSPADRMKLTIGSIITHINEEEMSTKEDFHEVITYNRSYIRIRLKRSDGEVIMVETPLYDDDVNNLGLLIL